MVLLIEPIDRVLKTLGYAKGTPEELIVLTSAKGNVFKQGTARSWAQLNRLCIICGHYEGVDERVAEFLIDQEVRIGDYVLTGGEPAAAVMTDAVVRLLPEVLGNEASLQGESHDEPGIFGVPAYSRPAVYENHAVPEILLSGDHVKIAEWKQNQRRLETDSEKSS